MGPLARREYGCLVFVQVVAGEFCHLRVQSGHGPVWGPNFVQFVSWPVLEMNMVVPAIVEYRRVLLQLRHDDEFRRLLMNVDTNRFGTVFAFSCMSIIVSNRMSVLPPCAISFLSLNNFLYAFFLFYAMNLTGTPKKENRFCIILHRIIYAQPPMMLRTRPEGRT